MRINKYLADRGYATRRGADELIKKRLVFVNGQVAALGAVVSDDDIVEVRGAARPKSFHYYLFNKPLGLATEDAPAAAKKPGLLPVGRLDKNSRGLILLTDDRRVSARLLSPERGHEREYVVKAANKLRPSFKKNMEAGVDIGGYTTQPCRVRILGDSEFAVVLTEGKKHQIRRMCEAMHNNVADLKRVRIANLKLGKLAQGQSRPLALDELKIFLQSLGLS